MRLVRYTYPNFGRPVSTAGRFYQSPWSGLENEIDRLFTSTVGDLAGTASTRVPVDVFADKDNTYVRADLPGVTRENIQVEVVDGYLTISAARKTPATEGQPEESFALTRSVQLSDEVQTEKIAAAYENGVLTITLPKREETKPKKVTVEVK